MKKEVTIREIAKMAGVSPTAVSFVINKKQGVSEETRDAVNRILKDTNYFQSHTKHSQKTNSFWFIKYSEPNKVVEGNTGFIISIMEEIERLCSEHNFRLSIRIATPSTFTQIIDSIQKDPLQGVFYIGTELSDQQLRELEAIPSPVVIIDNFCHYHDFDSIVMSNEDIVYKAVSYLYEKGHRDIGYLSSNYTISNFTERDAAFFNIMRQYNLSPSAIVPLSPSLPDAYEDMCKYLSLKEKLPAAFFAANDTLALASIKALTDYGYNIPKDISIIGIDDILYSSVSSPPLTTIHISCKDIGAYSIKLMLDKLKNPYRPQCRYIIGGTLIERQSVISI